MLGSIDNARMTQSLRNQFKEIIVLRENDTVFRLNEFQVFFV